MQISIVSFGATLAGAATFNFYAQPSVERLYPAIGPAAGGTVLTISGSHFPPGDALCRFGGGAAPEEGAAGTQSGGMAVASVLEPILARRVPGSNTELACTAPALSPGVRALEIVWNGQDYVRSAQPFEVYSLSVVHLLSPACGPVLGRTPLHITGGVFTRRAADLGQGRFGREGLRGARGRQER